MEGSHLINVPKLPDLDHLFMLMDRTHSQPGNMDDTSFPSNNTSPSNQHFSQLESNIQEAIVASQCDIAKSLDDFHVATATALAAVRTSSTVAVDTYAQEAEDCQVHVLEAQTEFRDSILSLQKLPGGHTDANSHDTAAAAAFGLHARMAAMSVTLGRLQDEVRARHNEAISQFSKATNAARAHLYTANVEAAKVFTRSINPHLDDSTETSCEVILQQLQGSTGNAGCDSPPAEYHDELEKYRVVMQMMNMAISVHKKIRCLTHN